MSKSGDILEQNIGRLVGTIGTALKRQLDRSLREFGQKMPAEQAILLLSINEHEGVSQQELTDMLFRNKTATTRWLDNLENRSLVMRVTDKADRRQKMIFLTPLGKKTVIGLRQIAAATEKRAIKGISQEKVKICKEVLKQVRDNLQD